MNNETAFQFFIAKHGGEMRQLFNALLSVRKDSVLEDFIINYLDRVDSNLIIFLLQSDNELVEKIKHFMLA